MSRRPTPTALKTIKGTDQPCRINKDEPKPKADKIRMPSSLSDQAKKQWRPVSKQLKEAGLLTNLDVYALELYCEAYAQWRHANDQIAKFGPVVKSPNGFPVQSPYLQIANKKFDQMQAMLREFGMTPSSRAKVSIVSADDDSGDPWDNL